MALVSSWYDLTTFANDSSVGTIAWSNPSNAGLSDNSYASFTTTSSSIFSYYLKCTGFSDYSIFTGTRITGVEVRVEAKRSAPNAATLNNMKLVKNGSVVGTSIPNTGISTTEQYYTFGGSSDLWGTTLAPSEIDANFGVAVSCFANAASSITVSIDHVQIRFYYEQGGILSVL